MQSEHAELLNALDEMQQSPAYAVRRPVLAQAEKLIASQEQEILKLRRRDEAVARLVKAMRDICWYDWCDNDRDAVAAIERGRTALASLTGDV